LYIDFDPTDEESSLGKYLRAVREEKEISIEELAEITRIKQSYLEAIEEDKYDGLPQGPYLQLFLKSYSEALDLDYEKVASYLETAAAQQAAKNSRPKPGKETPAAKQPEQKPQTLKPVVDIHDKRQQAPQKAASDTKKYLGIIGAVVFIAFIAVMIIIIATQKPQEEESVPTEGAADSVAMMTPVDSAAIKLDQFLNSFDSLTVSIYPASQQAVTIVADDRPQTKLVYPERIWSVTARDSLFVKFERADSSRIYLNGYLMDMDSLAPAANRGVMFDRNNWINYVDTAKVEGQ
jgi:cytoskeletal protein RodZ